MSGEGIKMNLGFIESKAYDEISVGDTANTEHVLTTDDAMAFASISGFHSVLNNEELIDRAGGVPPMGPNMWCASLISGLFSYEYTGAWRHADRCIVVVPCSHPRGRSHSGQGTSFGQGRCHEKDHV